MVVFLLGGGGEREIEQEDHLDMRESVCDGEE